MNLEKESLTHKIEDDLAARNRNWDKIEDFHGDFTSHLAESANKAHGGFKGALINMPYGIMYSIPNDTMTALQFEEVQYDTGNIYNSLEPSRLTVPQGVSKVKVSANVVFSFASTGMRELAIYKNGSGFRGTPRVNTQAPTDTELSILNVASGVLEVNGGDYFEVYVRQTSGSALNVSAVNTTRANSIWFALEVIE